MTTIEIEEPGGIRSLLEFEPLQQRHVLVVRPRTQAPDHHDKYEHVRPETVTFTFGWSAPQYAGTDGEVPQGWVEAELIGPRLDKTSGEPSAYSTTVRMRWEDYAKWPTWLSELAAEVRLQVAWTP
jgi:hypothetical protein